MVKIIISTMQDENKIIPEGFFFSIKAFFFKKKKEKNGEYNQNVNEE